MKVKISIGAVELELEGLDLNRRQVHQLLESCGSIALAIEDASPNDEPEPKAPVGFTAQIELDPERNFEPDLSEWFEESP